MKINLRKDNRGVMLIIVLVSVLIAVILAGVILSFVLSQHRFTHHQASRIQAYYASLAAMNLVNEKIRAGTWGTGTYTLCNSGCTINDADINYKVTIIVSNPDASGVRTIKLNTPYSYTP